MPERSEAADLEVVVVELPEEQWEAEAGAVGPPEGCVGTGESDHRSLCPRQS